MPSTVWDVQQAMTRDIWKAQLCIVADDLFRRVDAVYEVPLPLATVLRTVILEALVRIARTPRSHSFALRAGVEGRVVVPERLGELVHLVLAQ